MMKVYSRQVHLTLTITMHNIQGLQVHYMDMKCNIEILGSDFICLTKTWAEYDHDSTIEMRQVT